MRAARRRPSRVPSAAGRGAVGDRHGGALLDLHEGLVRRDKETAFGEVGLQGGSGVGERLEALARWDARIHALGQVLEAAASWAARSPVALRV